MKLLHCPASEAKGDSDVVLIGFMNGNSLHWLAKWAQKNSECAEALLINVSHVFAHIVTESDDNSVSTVIGIILPSPLL